MKYCPICERAEDNKVIDLCRYDYECPKCQKTNLSDYIEDIIKLGIHVVVSHWSDFDYKDAVYYGTLSKVDKCNNNIYYYIEDMMRGFKYVRFPTDKDIKFFTK